MKLLFFSKLFDNYAGGGEITLKTFLEIFVEEKENACVLVTQVQGSKRKVEIFSPNFQIVRIPESELAKEVNSQISFFKPDFIGGQHEWGRKVLLNLRNNSLPKMYFIKIAHEEKMKYGHLFSRIFLIDLFIVHSKFMQKLVWQNLKRKAIFCRPLVYFSQYKIGKNSKKYITMINYRLEKGKEIFDKIAQELPQKQFLAIKGWKSIKKTVGQQQKNILIEGPFKDMREVYSKTRLLLIPSMWGEPFPRVVLEAAASGIPIIASNDGGLKEAVGNAGIIIDNFSNKEDWVKEIKKMDNEKYYQKMSAKIVKKYADYDARKEAKKIFNEMNLVLEKRKKVFYKSKIIFQYFLSKIIWFFYDLVFKKIIRESLKKKQYRRG